MSTAEAVERYLPELQAAVGKIEARMDEMDTLGGFATWLVPAFESVVLEPSFQPRLKRRHRLAVDGAGFPGNSRTAC